MIRNVVPDVPANCQVVGGLYDMPDRSLNGEDMVEVALPNGILISAGWSFEGDSHGHYRVVATEGFELLIERQTQDVFAARMQIEELAQTLLLGGMLSGSASTYDTALDAVA